MDTSLRLDIEMSHSPLTRLTTKFYTERKKNTDTELSSKSLRDLTPSLPTEMSQRPDSPTSTKFSTDKNVRPDTTPSSTRMSESSMSLSTELSRRPDSTLFTRSNTSQSLPLRLVKSQLSPMRLLSEMRRLSPTPLSTRPAPEMSQSRGLSLATPQTILEMALNLIQRSMELSSQDHPMRTFKMVPSN